MATMTQATFHFNRLMLTLIFGIRASDSPVARRMAERPGLIGFNNLRNGPWIALIACANFSLDQWVYTHNYKDSFYRNWNKTNCQCKQRGVLLLLSHLK